MKTSSSHRSAEQAVIGGVLPRRSSATCRASTASAAGPSSVGGSLRS
jgi:hypothetical protein